MTKSMKQAEEITSLIKARNPLIWIVSKEEARVERYVAEAAIAAKYLMRTWDIAAGVCTLNGQPDTDVGDLLDPGAALDAIKDRGNAGGERCVWVMRDLPVWLGNGMQGAATLRRLRNAVRSLPNAPVDNMQAIVVISPDGNVPAELGSNVSVVEWPLPDREEIASILDAAVGMVSGKYPEVAAALGKNGTRDAAIDAAVGLTGEEAAATYAKSLVQFKRIDPKAISAEKKRVVSREKVLEWFDPIAGGLDAVGGLENLKTWLVQRKLAYSPAARAYGLPAPKGAMLVGVPGCGKSLTAKAISTAWGVPLLKLDLGALKGKFVGESEGNIRRAFATIAAIGRCVVWIDEIEKGMQGATSGSADGGASADQLGALLNWMQERQGESFVIATANDVAALPPELLRKGRFDEVWFVDLPNRSEREGVLKAALKSHGREGELIDLPLVAGVTEGFTGSEIAALVPDAMFVAFADAARPIVTSDLTEAAKTVVPLSKTAAEKIAALRNWAAGRARAATAAEAPAKATTKAGREIDL